MVFRKKIEKCALIGLIIFQSASLNGYDSYPARAFKKQYPELYATLNKAEEDSDQTAEYIKWKRLCKKRSAIDHELRGGGSSRIDKKSGMVIHYHPIQDNQKVSKRNELEKKEKAAWQDHLKTPQYKAYSKLSTRYHTSVDRPVCYYRNKENLSPEVAAAIQSYDLARNDWLACATSKGLEASECDDVYERFAQAKEQAIAETDWNKDPNTDG